MTRAGERTVVLQAASLLLQYPDARIRAGLPTIRAAVTGLAAGTCRRRLLEFIEHAEGCAPQALEEHYVAVLDRERRCCLHLSWWTDGDTRRRGPVLARLKDIYRRHGLVLAGGELPDYLPVLLEFAAVGDQATGMDLLAEYRAGLEMLRLALIDLRSPYAAPVEAVCALLPGPSPADEAAARALARTGPPTEQVGLQPYPVPVGGPR
jgi:nitrate reductase molybdenum cofactor assembly chaperone NarJ/NarW